MDRNKLIDKCNSFLDEMMNLNDLPGLAIGVSIGGVGVRCSANAAICSDADSTVEPVEFVGVRGYRDYAARTPLEEDDIFHCASVSKLFTSAAIMKLVEADTLHLDDRLCDLLPDLRIADRRYKEVRLWNMLSHTSGLGDVSDYHWYDHETDEDSLRRYVYESDEVLSQPMLWEPQVSPEYLQRQASHQPQDPQDSNPSPDHPAARFRYSNIAYEILGQIVAEYSDCKLSYEDFVARYLLEPAGMSSSTMKTFERAPYSSNDRMAQPHEKKPDRSIGLVEYYPYTRQHAPSSTLTSNVRDLLKYGRAHLASSRGMIIGAGPALSGNGSLLKPETYQAIWQPYATVPNNGEKMGLGWFMREQTISVDAASEDESRTFRLYGHEGTDDGFRASFWICPEVDLVTVVLSNLSGAPVKRINKKLFDRIVR